MSLGYVVRPGLNNACMFSIKEVTYNNNQRYLKKIYAIAHELGHAATIGACKDEFGEKVITGRSDYTATRWYILEAELRAWEFAEYLGRKFGFYGPKMLKYKHSCLRSYYRF